MEDTYKKFLKKEYENDERNLYRFMTCVILCALGFFALMVFLVVGFTQSKKSKQEHIAAVENIPDNLYAVHVSTNLVSVPCKCGFCDTARGVRVREHINQIGYDLKYEVSTSYYPVVILKTNNNER